MVGSGRPGGKRVLELERLGSLVILVFEIQRKCRGTWEKLEG